MSLTKVFIASRYPDDLEKGTFRKAIEEEKFEIVDLADADYALCLDFDPRTLKQLKSSSIGPDRRALIMREPEAVLPSAHAGVVEAEFKVVFMMGSRQKSGKVIQWPQIFSDGQFPSSPKEGVCAVASWRVSFMSRNLYGLRARAFRCFEIDTYGRGWHDGVLTKLKEVVFQLRAAVTSGGEMAFQMDQLTSTPRHYMGELRDKMSLKGKYKVMLVIENSPDYMSEKLFDAFRLGSIPVYCGAQTSDYGIPSDLVIQVNPELEAIEAGIKLALSLDYSMWVKRLNRWLKEPSTRETFEASWVWSDVLNLVKEEWGLDDNN